MKYTFKPSHEAYRCVAVSGQHIKHVVIRNSLTRHVLNNVLLFDTRVSRKIYCLYKRAINSTLAGENVIFRAANHLCHHIRPKLNQRLIVRTDYYVERVPDHTLASAGCHAECGIFNDGLSCPMFATNAAHLVKAPPTHFAGLPLLDTCCCSCFGVTHQHYINKGHEELMRKGKEGILAAGTLTSGWRFLALQTY